MLKILVILFTTLKPMMNALLSQQRLGHCHKTGLFKRRSLRLYESQHSFTEIKASPLMSRFIVIHNKEKPTLNSDINCRISFDSS